MQTLRQRGQIRDVSAESINDLKALEQRAEDRLERTNIGANGRSNSGEASK
jgi:NADH-quinone oxidoreductase subunit J